MFGMIALAMLLAALFGMGLFAWLIDHYEAPLHERDDDPPADPDQRLVEQAKHATKTGKQRLN